jgi:hypothetical protein
MNRLKGLACYLSGPIDFAKDHGRSWRDDVTLALRPRNVYIFNPLKHAFFGTQDLDANKRPRMEKMLEDGDFSGLREEVKDLNHWDLRAIDLSSFLIVNYDINTFMCGTHEEIFTANRQSKPVLLMVGDKRKKLPKWMFGRFPPEHMFESWVQLLQYLCDIDTAPDYKFTDADHKRWLFLDGNHMYETYPRNNE